VSDALLTAYRDVTYQHSNKIVFRFKFRIDTFPFFRQKTYRILRNVLCDCTFRKAWCTLKTKRLLSQRRSSAVKIPHLSRFRGILYFSFRAVCVFRNRKRILCISYKTFCSIDDLQDFLSNFICLTERKSLV
jgi:hypothetical protein